MVRQANGTSTLDNGQRSTVNPVCPITQPVSGTGEKLTIDFVYTSRLQSFKTSGRLQHHPSTSFAATSHKAKIFQTANIVIILSQLYFGRPMRLCPCGCQAKTFLIQRCRGSVAKYCAKFQWCRRQISDHDLDPICEVKARTRSFQKGKVKGHGYTHFILQGGPSTDRRSRRYATSILRKSLRYMVRCPATKQVKENMTRSKYSSF